MRVVLVDVSPVCSVAAAVAFGNSGHESLGIGEGRDDERALDDRPAWLLYRA